MALDYMTSDGDTVDEICFKYYGDREGACEAVLAANPGLAGAGLILSAGRVITLPDLAVAKEVVYTRMWS